MSLVRLENVTKVYKTNGIGFPALGGVSFSVEKGEFLSIAGPSGSGKTTILNIIGCLDKPTGGSFFLEDRDISTRKSGELADIRRHHIGFIFQTFNLIPILTAFENVEFPLILKGDLDQKERRSLVEEILTDVGLKDFLHRKPSQLSGGQQQRVSIARALVKKPPIYIFDDSFSALDYRTDAALRRALREQTGDSTVLIVSQRIATIMNAQQIIVLDEGRIVGRGAHQELMQDCEVYRGIALAQLSQEELS